MSTVAGSSRELLRTRMALEQELQRTTHYLRHIKEAKTPDEKIHFLNTFYSYLRTHHMHLSQHVGFRLFILNQMALTRKMAWDRRYATHPHMRQILASIADIEKIIRETPIKGAF